MYTSNEAVATMETAALPTVQGFPPERHRCRGAQVSQWLITLAHTAQMAEPEYTASRKRSYIYLHEAQRKKDARSKSREGHGA